MSRAARLFSTALVGLSLLALPAVLLLTSPARSRQAPQAAGCVARPIAFHISTVAGLEPGDSLGDVYRGSGAGNFAWLRWPSDIGAGNQLYLLMALADPNLAALDFENARDPGDTLMSPGDWIWAGPRLSNSAGAQDTLDALLGQDIRVPIWDLNESTGVWGAYHIVGFAQVRLTGYELVGQNRLSVQFQGWDNEACPQGLPDKADFR